MEVLILSFVILAALVVMGQQVTKTIGLSMETDPLLMAKASGIKLLTSSWEMMGCVGCEINLPIYVPTGSIIQLENRVLTVKVYDKVVLQVETPILTDRNIVGEGWHYLILQSTSSGVKLK